MWLTVPTVMPALAPDIASLIALAFRPGPVDLAVVFLDVAMWHVGGRTDGMRFGAGGDPDRGTDSRPGRYMKRSIFRAVKNSRVSKASIVGKPSARAMPVPLLAPSVRGARGISGAEGRPAVPPACPRQPPLTIAEVAPVQPSLSDCAPHFSKTNRGRI